MYEEQLQMNKKKTGNLNRKIGKGYKWTDHLKRSPLASKCRNQRCAPESEKWQLQEHWAQHWVPVWENKASNYWLKTPAGVEVPAGETPSLTGEFVRETHRVLERTQTHPLGKQHQKGPIWLLVAEGVTEIRQRVEQRPLLPLGPSPTYSVTAQWPVLPRPGEHLRLRPFK